MSEEFVKVEPYGFWKQVNPIPMTYTEEYEKSQSTTMEMSWLRLGEFSSRVSMLFKKTPDYSKWKVCDVGSGNGTFQKEASKVFGYACGYDVVGSSISKEELYGTHWNAIFLTDVLEHFTDINDLFKITTDIVYLSFPECPKVDDWRELKTWRHYKPNEHLWMLNGDGVVQWLIDNGWLSCQPSHVEDMIRRNPDVEHNISTIVAFNKRIFE